MNTKTISRFLLLLSTFACSVSTISAQKTVNKTYQKMDSLFYVDKAAKMNSTGWILAGVGAAVGIGGAFVIHNSSSSLDGIGDMAAGTGLVVVGCSAAITGIVLIARSSYYRNKALQASLSMGEIQVQRLQASSVKSSYVPSLTLHIHF